MGTFVDFLCIRRKRNSHPLCDYLHYLSLWKGGIERDTFDGGANLVCHGIHTHVFHVDQTDHGFLLCITRVFIHRLLPLFRKPNTFNFHNGGRLETKSLAPSGYHTMQALMSMVVSVAGFTTPGIISAFVLRKPEEVDASSDNREFAPWALFAPVLSLIVLVGLLYMHWIKKPLETTAKEEVDETSSLMDTTPLKWSRKDYSVPSFDPKTIAARRECLTLMCIPQITYEDFQEEENHGRRTSTGSIPVVHADGYQQTRKSYFF